MTNADHICFALGDHAFDNASIDCAEVRHGGAHLEKLAWHTEMVKQTVRVCAWTGLSSPRPPFDRGRM